MSFVRLFVGNIPSGTTEDEISSEFGFYGVVKKIELKTKNEFELFAFVNLEIEEKLVEKCIREFSQQKFKGNFLKVSRAKESFLDRLKREREESSNIAAAQSQNDSYNFEDYSRETYKTLPKIEKQVSSGESSESEEDEEMPVASEISARKLQVIEAAKSFKSHDLALSKAEMDDKKRQESLKKLKDRHQEQKNAIKNALAMSSEFRSNKIVFEPPEPVEVEDKQVKSQLFDDEEEEEEEPQKLTVKKQFAGKSGAKMLELQSRFQGDERFQIDERFADENFDGLIDSKKRYTREELKERKKMRKEMLNWDQDELKEERDNQLSILESITGQSTGLVRSQNKPNFDRKEMLRFDPKKEEHKKYLDVVRGDEDVDDVEMSGNQRNESFQVSEEKFYQVSDNLASALQSTSEQPFSIFAMLGVSHDDPEEEEKKAEEIEPKILTKLPIFQANQMKFQYDSSDTDEDEENRKQQQQKKKKLPRDNQNQQKTGKYSKSGIFRLNFFYTDTDPRFKEGLNFLKLTEQPNKDSFEATRKNLKQIIKTRVRKARESQRKNEKNFKKRKVQ